METSNALVNRSVAVYKELSRNTSGLHIALLHDYAFIH